MIDAAQLEAHMRETGQRARLAARAIAEADAAARTAALHGMASALRANSSVILRANEADIRRAQAKGLADSFIDRLTLTPQRLDAIAAGAEAIASIADPVGAVVAEWTPPNGLHIKRVRTPIGVIGMIFESRPNVAADAAALALRAGNAIILRGGSDSSESVAAIVDCLRTALAGAGLPEDAVQAAPADRAAVGAMLAGLDGAIDLIVPRGGKDLVTRVMREARTAVLAHAEGVCHTYIHTAADAERALAIAVNAKMRRVSVCGATETLLIDRTCAQHILPLIAAALRGRGCVLRGDAEARAIVTMDAAGEDDWRSEYLAPILAVRVVADIGEAIAHIAAYGSQHTDAIVTEDAAAAARFLQEVDSAIVMHNASTQFADGGEFGFGGEIGIATGRLHARGPVGAEQLTTYKYVVTGTGHIRS